MDKGFIVDDPILMKQWHWERNNAICFYPDKLKRASNKRVWWKCDVCGHEWMTTPNNRTRGTGCPACSNKILVKGKNDLASLYPEIAKKWHPTKNAMRPDEVFAHSRAKVWWICEKDNRHVFVAKISHLTEGRIFCPICSNQQIMVGVNDLATTNPELLKEWDYEKNLLTPQQVTYGTNKKVWWKCLKGHSWQAVIASRGGLQKTACPKCKNELRVSLPEKTLSFYLSKTLQVEESKHFPWLGYREIDLYLPTLNLGIEYDGRQWHKNTERDILKDDLCHKNGLTLLRIREDGCPVYPTTAILLTVPVFSEKVAQLQAMTDVVFPFLNKEYGIDLSTPTVKADFFAILPTALTLQKKNSIANSPLIDEWNYKRNAGIDPSLLSLGAHKKAWWVCKNEHEWQAAIYSRASGVGCPYCAGQKVLTGYNDLQTLYPEIAKEWNFTKNSISPASIRPKSNKKYWWICKSCNNEWLSSVADQQKVLKSLSLI